MTGEERGRRKEEKGECELVIVKVMSEVVSGYLRFEDLEVWKKARQLVAHVFTISKAINDRDFRSQLQRAAISIMNNIAEGHESGSVKSRRQFLRIAKASCGEVRSMFYAGSDVRYFESDDLKLGIQKAEEISRMLAGFIRKLT